MSWGAGDQLKRGRWEGEIGWGAEGGRRRSAGEWKVGRGDRLGRGRWEGEIGEGMVRGGSGRGRWEGKVGGGIWEGKVRGENRMHEEGKV